MFNFDPSQMDPKVLMQMTELVRQLPPDKISRMQTLMHNMMAGYDVSKDMEEFEKSLPAGFREKLLAIMANQPMPGFNIPPSASTIQPPSSATYTTTSTSTEETNLREARLTILRAVAQGHIPPEEAERLLFSGS